MDFNQNDQRNVVYLTNLPEWKSFERYLDTLEKRALTVLKTSGDTHKVYNAQGEERVIETIRGVRERMRSLIEEANNV